MSLLIVILGNSEFCGDTAETQTTVGGDKIVDRKRVSVIDEASRS